MMANMVRELNVAGDANARRSPFCRFDIAHSDYAGEWG
jgi:hypothetical protein